MLSSLHDTLPVGGAAPAGESISVLVQCTQSLPLQECRFDDFINSSSNAASI